MDNDFFAPPPFKAEEALVQLKRALRDLRALTERGTGWSFENQEVLTLAAGDGVIDARLAKKPARSPDWEARTLRNAADVRKLQDELKRRLAQWADE
ncbi:hypothetical protein [Mitsuaria sp. GD03876]|uniref:hypothetical protein n=1 Tax=Mitsuaria sp. GD03876 TaxID=2975399 RepID=UPI00244C80B0|nr:hypothetical protein [Mitsuaria sp. GD03876]MDH0867465.1 hypothetical protein [Mitsuaria sp. GD03876]